jgi:hypothetical protein
MVCNCPQQMVGLACCKRGPGSTSGDWPVLPSYSHRRFVCNTSVREILGTNLPLPMGHGSGFLENIGKTCHASTMLAIWSLIIVV